jgi:hypothetical protein
MMTFVKETPEPKGVHDTHNRMCNRFLYESYGSAPATAATRTSARAVAPYGLLPRTSPTPWISS